MADTGWKFPGTMDGNRLPNTAWVNPDNAKADDGSNATVTLVGTSTSSALAASNFDFSSIPADAHIDGIEIRVGDYSLDTGSSHWIFCKLILADDSDGSENKSSVMLDPTTSLQTDEVGGASDLWTENIRRADVTDVDFGFFIQTTNTSGTVVLSVDFMQMRVFYHEGFPAVILGSNGALPGYSPPFKSSAGNFYVAVFDDGDDDIDVYKATDPTDSWTVQDDTNNPNFTTNVITLTAVQSGDVIHIAYFVAGLDIDYQYGNFNMADDTWGETTEDIDTDTATADQRWISIAVRSDGDVVVVYNGDTDNNMGDAKERVDVNIRTGGTWGGPVALDAGGDIHYGNPNCILGTNDGVHIIWQINTATGNDPPTLWSAPQARTLDAGDTLNSVDDVGTSFTGTALLGSVNLLTYDDGGTQRVIGNGSNGIFRDVIGIEDGSDDLDITAVNVTNPDPQVKVTNEFPIITMAELSGELHILYSSTTDSDIYYTKSTDDSLNWDSVTEELDAITCNFISANIYKRGSDTVMAYVYDDGGVQKYNEKILISWLLLERRRAPGILINR